MLSGQSPLDAAVKWGKPRVLGPNSFSSRWKDAMIFWYFSTLLELGFMHLCLIHRGEGGCGLGTWAAPGREPRGIHSHPAVPPFKQMSGGQKARWEEHISVNYCI